MIQVGGYQYYKAGRRRDSSGYCRASNEINDIFIICLVKM